RQHARRIREHPDHAQHVVAADLAALHDQVTGLHARLPDLRHEPRAGDRLLRRRRRHRHRVTRAMAVAITPVHPGSTATAGTARLRVAHVTANSADGSGGITLREALALDPGRFSSTIIAPADGSLFGRAEAAGPGVVRRHAMGAGAGGSP